MSAPTPQQYAELFEDDVRGAAILDDLTRRFAGKIYVKGGHEADRETCYRAGQRDVIEWIVSRINRAHGVNDNVEGEDQ